jgi:hypothetical protein
MADCEYRGRHVTAEFWGTFQQPDKTKGEKVYPGKFLVQVQDGEALMSVEYADQVSAEVVLPWLTTAKRGDVVTVPFGVRSAQGYTFYYGRRAS